MRFTISKVLLFLTVGLFIGSSILLTSTNIRSESIYHHDDNNQNINNREMNLLGESRYFQTNSETNNFYGTNGPLGEWPDFTPMGFITAPHPDYPEYQTHLYGDWGGIVGEEFIFLQEGLIKLLYHSYHETYLTNRIHEENILDNWTLGYDKVTKIKHTPLVQPGGPIPGPAFIHTDTPSYIQHPITGEHLIYNTVRPGTLYEHPEWDGLPGSESAIQVSTSETLPTIGVPFNQTYENMLVAEYWWEQGWNQNGEIKGGLSEPTPVWVPHLGTQGKIRLFYRGLHGSPSSYWNWRISYADSENGKNNWVKNPIPTFDPSDPDNPAYRWTLPWPDGFSFRGAWQAHCTGDIRADGVHMVLMVSNQNYAGSGHIAYYWSPDWGDTWIGHPENPIIAPGQFPDGVPSQGFQRTPTLLIDEEYGRYILGYNAGHDIDESWKRHSYIATASRPLINQQPFANFTFLPSNPTNADTIFFTDQSVDPDGILVNWTWDFGDGTTSNIQNPTHQYTNPTMYSICLTVEDDQGTTDTICKDILVTGIDVNQSIHDRGFPIRHTWDGDWGSAQNFTATLNTLTSCEIYLRKFGTPEFNLTVELRTDHPEGTLLDTLSFNPEELASSWQWLEVDFEDITIEPDTNLFIVLPPAPSTVTTSFGYEWGYAFGDQYQPGSFWFTRDGGNLWRDLPTMYEFVFRTYGYM